MLAATPTLSLADLLLLLLSDVACTLFEIDIAGRGNQNAAVARILERVGALPFLPMPTLICTPRPTTSLDLGDDGH